MAVSFVVLSKLSGGAGSLVPIVLKLLNRIRRQHTAARKRPISFWALSPVHVTASAISSTNSNSANDFRFQACGGLLSHLACRYQIGVSSMHQRWKHQCSRSYRMNRRCSEGTADGVTLGRCVGDVSGRVAFCLRRRTVGRSASGFVLDGSPLRGEIQCARGRTVGAKQGRDRGRNCSGAALPEQRHRTNRQSSGKAPRARFIRLVTNDICGVPSPSG